MIEFRDVSLGYGDHPVLSDIDLKIQLYERVAVFGGSGSGKTSMLKLILGLERPDSGRVVINDLDITQLPESKLRDTRVRFNIVFQEGALFDSMSVRENAAFCLRERSNLTEAEIDKRVREVLRQLGIEEAIDMMPEQLSGGMQQRVAIARSLAECEPKMFLYDEPTTGLDPITTENICDLINDLSAGDPPDNKGFIIVTHRVMDVIRLADRLIFLHKGGVRFDGNIEDLRQNRDQLLRDFFKQLFDQSSLLSKV
jgi:phospholipid/cholesterol/gamma-HCH transport system ATP-binding protein